ncbi:MAG: hypothetical protein ACRDI3_03895, partial [Actinomycetota bacterium]
MRRVAAPLVAGISLLATLASSAPAAPSAALPKSQEPGFYVHPYAVTGGTPSSLAFGPDTRKGEDGRRLYVTDNAGGTVLVIDDLGGVGSAPEVFAEGFNGPLGVLPATDGSVFVADAEPAREGPFGFRSYGRVWRVIDKD